MNITFNGKQYQVETNSVLIEFVESLDLNLSGAAMAINQRFIPRADYKTTVLQDNDVLEMIIPMQGG